MRSNAVGSFRPRVCENVEQFEAMSLVRRFNTSSANRMRANRRRCSAFDQLLYK